ncbi:MAG: putative LPS assembly protein LptD, partial [Calditrichia bacterium]
MSRTGIHFSIFFLLIFLWAGGGFGQADIFSDSLAAEPQPDSLFSAPPKDTLQTDTTNMTAPQQDSGLEGPVKYSARLITFSVDGRKSYLSGDVHIEYQNMSLDAGKVMINWDRNIMVATQVQDSTDSLGNPVYSGIPVFKEKGTEPITGVELEYDFKNKRGKVLSGRTKMEPGYYKGETIKKVGERTLLVKDGYFTSCDSIENSDFYFRAKEMRIIAKKRAIAKPIIMYIADVPILAIPFGVFPMERGRRSGIIIPSYGESSYGGRYLRNLGFYWAASQYW